MATPRRVLIVVENLTVPLDRRVWQEATSLKNAGHTVSVICPTGGVYQARRETIDGIEIFRHALPIEADGALGYLAEYTIALFWQFLLSFKVKAKVGFDVIQACNPPDTIFLLAAFWRLVSGTRFVFDHHDLNPELYEAKFGRRGRLHRILLWLEKMTFRLADVSLATNLSYRQIAIERGGMSEDRVFIVRSVPDLSRFERRAPSPALRNGRRILAGYVGVMGAQDGVDNLIRAMHHLVHDQGRQDIQCVLVGRGTEVPKLKDLVATLQLKDHVTFTGYLSPEDFLRAISTFDIGVVPDPKNPFNDKCSMNKVFEYMSLAIPLAGFDLTETIRSAGDAALYANNNDPHDLARRIAELADDADLRARLGAAGAQRARTVLDWRSEEVSLLAAYEKAFEDARAEPAGTRPANPLGAA
jgi:glycosyltransferase involved in cell wall biosynthesis